MGSLLFLHFADTVSIVYSHSLQNMTEYDIYAIFYHILSANNKYDIVTYYDLLWYITPCCISALEHKT